ncbi:uncharacterized protein K452DRAFT_309204 [Aplosporella prunicola CBS 121167]|uniref:PWI domain-containing protein n=1 Tax=Aplosporella prunicola CBS 121167 TaxID=1176127 RepID=A0A6A6BBG0_9PEZI|nr:uncharacterized protein K452DRAFT_309204 [Aplosporella prunicola CBS 121167]KAF2141450.1 hypothetical protein K452DRAFT_309204 [Aplosporella prunicola CBS 121167]
MAPPPGMGPPPGAMPAPGVSAPPGIQQAQSPLPARPGNLPPNFQPPAGMPNINFSAPVIRLGTTGPSPAPSGRKESAAEPLSAGGRRPGLGGDLRGDSQRGQMRDSIMSLQPPTREEIMRTIFIGNIPDGVGGDDGVERILRTAGNLRRWSRVTDADDKPCKFGFAEYEDAQSLETAAEIFKNGVEVPLKKQEAMKTEEEVEKTILLVKVDEASMAYAEEWKGKRDEDESAAQFRVDTAKEALTSVIHSLFHPREAPTQDNEGDVAMGDSETKIDGATGEVVTIPLTVEDELSDIPPEMRETVAAEIAAFRDRSVRRDMERLAREEEMEKLERQRGSGARINRLASPPTTAPSGPGGGANGIPLGPSKRGVEGAPSGPKAFTGAQIPKDYQNGVAFVNGSSSWIHREDEDDPASDEELERRRKAKQKAEEDKSYREEERRWQNREKSRTAALAREKKRDDEEEKAQEAEKDAMAKRLADWDDDEESARKAEEYYSDRPMWLRNRQAFRQRESAADQKDREAEDRENARETEKREQARGLADSFLDRTASELSARSAAAPTTPREPARFKMSLAAAASQRAQQAAPRRTAAEVEGLLEDEEDTEQSQRRKVGLIPFDPNDLKANMTEEEKREAAKQLAADIPNDLEGLVNWQVDWKYIDEEIMKAQLHPFIEKKIEDYLGVREQMLVDVVEEHVRGQGKPDDLIKVLEEALDEEAEPLVKKLWRMIIFFSESEKRGIAA